MKLNKNLILSVLVIGVLIVIIQSIVIVYQNHVDKQYLYLELLIEEAALKCNRESVCSDVVTIGYLYDKEYLEQIVNPITNKIVDETIEVEVDNNYVIINEGIWK